MAKGSLLVLALAQLSFVHSRPAADIKRGSISGGDVHSSASPVPKETSLGLGSLGSVAPVAGNIFQPLIDSGIAPSISKQSGHPVKKQFNDDGDIPVQTNKFYTNFFLGNQTLPVFTSPYSLTWASVQGKTAGMAVSHSDREDFIFGPDATKPRFFSVPLGNYSMILSAAELGTAGYLSVGRSQAFSAYANLAPAAGKPPVISFPLVQGMGLVTGIYDKATPIINSGVQFKSMNLVESSNDTGTYKYRVQLNDNRNWLMYVTPAASAGVPTFMLADIQTISGPAGFSGLIQVAKNPANGTASEAAFDASAGAYAANATLSAAVNGSVGSYTLAWTKGGNQKQTLLMYALPHHVEAFDATTKAAMKSDLQIASTVKGIATAVLADRITMVENDLPTSIGFAPWAKFGTTGGSEKAKLPDAAKSLIDKVGVDELSQDMEMQTRLNSMYYSGKGLAKFATIIYTLNSMTGNTKVAAAGLNRLKDAMNVFVNNTQPVPLIYDTVWKGVVSSASYKPPYDTGLDFGNSLYNDHHFHYGYFLWTAAVIGYMDPEWLDVGSNKAWVNSLVRDFANPVGDKEFPFSRSFDWYHGHSWAKGLFESHDGKDQESTSEDTFATHALKMWGKVSRDANMEARGNLQLAIQTRSVNKYFLMANDNQVQPKPFIANKVTGILFEGKADHVTYFGDKPEFIQGIHMIPLNPCSAYTRPARFVQEEWDTFFAGGRVDATEAGWRGILYANLALIDATTSYNYFADPNFNLTLDGGASRTWYLAYAAAMQTAGTPATKGIRPSPGVQGARNVDETGPEYR